MIQRCHELPTRRGTGRAARRAEASRAPQSCQTLPWEQPEPPAGGHSLPSERGHACHGPSFCRAPGGRDRATGGRSATADPCPWPCPAGPQLFPLHRARVHCVHSQSLIKQNVYACLCSSKHLGGCAKPVCCCCCSGWNWGRVCAMLQEPAGLPGMVPSPGTAHLAQSLHPQFHSRDPVCWGRLCPASPWCRAELLSLWKCWVGTCSASLP